jgi:rod shape-determining protein MreC
MVNLKRYGNVLIVAAALAIPFWFLRYSMKRQEHMLAAPDTLIVKLIAPIQYAAATLARGLSGVWTDYVYLVDVKDNNAKLSAEGGRLKARVRKLEAFEAENRRLRGLLELRQHLNVDVVSAHVVAKDTVEFFRVAQVLLDRPSRDIVSGARLPVIALDGVVGVTGKVAGDNVEVQLVVDAGSGVDVIVQRTGARGFIQGTGDQRRYRCKVEYVKRTDEVEVGDLLVTSGVGRRFPKGMPVAKVTTVERKDFGIYQTVRAEPTVDFSRLDDVLIVVTSRAANDLRKPAKSK